MTIHRFAPTELAEYDKETLYSRLNAIMRNITKDDLVWEILMPE